MQKEGANNSNSNKPSRKKKKKTIKRETKQKIIVTKINTPNMNIRQQIFFSLKQMKWK